MRRRVQLALLALSFAAPLAAQVGPSSLPAAQPDHATTKEANAPFAIRLERVSVNVPTTADCISVLPDGRYRREHSEEAPFVGKAIIHPRERSKTYVYEGRLQPEELENVRRILDAPEFRSLREPERLRSSSEFLSAAIFRDGSAVQRFRLGEATDYKPNQKALKPLFEWWKALEKRNDDLVKGADERTNCQLPDRLPLRPPVPESNTTN